MTTQGASSAGPSAAQRLGVGRHFSGEHDFAVHVSAGEFRVGVPDLLERVDRGDWHGQPAPGDVLGHRREDVRGACLRAGFGLRAIALRGGEVNDGVDPVGRNAEVGREVYIAIAVGVDERVDTVRGE